jgi:hypothetical protein
MWQKTPPTQRKETDNGNYFSNLKSTPSQLSTTEKLQETESIPLGRLRRDDARHITSENSIGPLTAHDVLIVANYLSVRSPFDTRLCSFDLLLCTVFNYSRIIWVVPFPVAVHR